MLFFVLLSSSVLVLPNHTFADTTKHGFLSQKFTVDVGNHAGGIFYHPTYEKLTFRYDAYSALDKSAFLPNEKMGKHFYFWGSAYVCYNSDLNINAKYYLVHPGQDAIEGGEPLGIVKSSTNDAQWHSDDNAATDKTTPYTTAASLNPPNNPLGTPGFTAPSTPGKYIIRVEISAVNTRFFNTHFFNIYGLGDIWYSEVVHHMGPIKLYHTFSVCSSDQAIVDGKCVTPIDLTCHGETVPASGPGAGQIGYNPDNGQKVPAQIKWTITPSGGMGGYKDFFWISDRSGALDNKSTNRNYVASYDSIGTKHMFAAVTDNAGNNSRYTHGYSSTTNPDGGWVQCQPPITITQGTPLICNGPQLVTASCLDSTHRRETSRVGSTVCSQTDTPCPGNQQCIGNGVCTNNPLAPGLSGSTSSLCGGKFAW